MAFETNSDIQNALWGDFANAQYASLEGRGSPAKAEGAFKAYNEYSSGGLPFRPGYGGNPSTPTIAAALQAGVSPYPWQRTAEGNARIGDVLREQNKRYALYFKKRFGGGIPSGPTPGEGQNTIGWWQNLMK